MPQPSTPPRLEYFELWVANMPDQLWVRERPVGEMAFERHRLPTLIGQGGMSKVIAAAAAAIALAPFSVLATTPGVAQATPGWPLTRARPTLVELGAALRGVGDSSVLCRLADPSFREIVERPPDG